MKKKTQKPRDCKARVAVQRILFDLRQRHTSLNQIKSLDGHVRQTLVPAAAETEAFPKRHLATLNVCRNKK